MTLKTTASRRRSTGRTQCCWAVTVWLAIGGAGLACNIPVFRYALERWRADQLELVVLVSAGGEAGADPLATKSIVQRWRQQLSDASAPNLNIQVVDIDSWQVAGQPQPDATGPMAAEQRQQLQQAWRQLAADKERRLPWVMLRGQHPRGAFTAWSGPLADASQAGLFDSPVRRELKRRLLAGDSIIWCVLAGSDSSATQAVVERLQRQNQQLQQSIQLPEGIGLPGSELFSEVPLLLKFSVLQVARDDADEQLLQRVFQGFQPEAYERGQPLVAPVFGRGRVLEVIPADQLRDQLIEDLTGFLCGACSCQVKEQNPGFDLLMSCDWKLELFGADGQQPPDIGATGAGSRRAEPELLTIPPGRRK